MCAYNRACTVNELETVPFFLQLVPKFGHGSLLTSKFSTNCEPEIVFVLYAEVTEQYYVRNL